MRLGKGWLPDYAKRAPIEVLLARLGVPVDGAIDDVDLEPFAPHVMDQGSTETSATQSCTGHAGAVALCASCGAQGMPLPIVPSPDGLYDNARCIDRADAVPAGPLPPLQDGGASIDALVRGMNRWGVRAIKAPTSDGRYSDCEPATINDEPTLGDLEDEAGLTVSGQYAIPTSPTTIREMRATLAAKHAILGAIFADTAVETWTLDDPPVGAPNRGDANGGGHAVAIIGYRTLPNGKTIFKVRNSWSADYGDRGNFWGDEAFAMAMLARVAMAVSVNRGGAS